MTNITR